MPAMLPFNDNGKGEEVRVPFLFLKIFIRQINHIQSFARSNCVKCHDEDTFI